MVTRVICPQCRAELDVKNRLNVEQKQIKCPNCGFIMLVQFRPSATPANMAPGAQGYQQPYQQQPYPQQPQQPYDNGQRRYGNSGQYNNGGQYGNGGQPQPFSAPTPSPAAPVAAPVQESGPVQNQGYTSNPAQQMPPDGDVYDEDIPF
jgi:DNA-directed RNA polymerase subunit RPC12/RpoP